MKPLLAVTGIALLVLAFPYVRCFFKRLLCFHKIKGACKRRGYALCGMHALWFLGGKNGVECDCYIETESELLAIKLFGAPRYRTVLVLCEDRSYFIRSFVSVVYPRFTIDGNRRPLPSYDFKIGCEGREARNILLVNPVPMEIRRQSGASEEVVSEGDLVCGAEVYSLPKLLLYLEKQR